MFRVLISLIVPVFNEQASLLPFLDRALPAMTEAVRCSARAPPTRSCSWTTAAPMRV
jgi:hypothetical protein